MSIELKNVDFSYSPEQHVLHDVTFTINDGQMVCLLGPNGVGKSTLFRVILRLLWCNEGEILVDGVSTKKYTASQMAKKIAYIPQSYAPTFNYSVFDMVLMGTTAGLSLFSSPGKKEKEIAEEAMERLGIAHLKNRGFSRISGGERQLALICRGLAQGTRTLILDEPTANLDYGNSIKVLEQIHDLAESGYTVLQATHQPDHAFLYADKVLALKDGTIIGEGSPKELIDQKFIEALYGVNVEVESLYDDRLRICIPVSAVKEKENEEE